MTSARVLLLVLVLPLTACKKDPAPPAGSGSAAATPTGSAAATPAGSAAATPTGSAAAAPAGSAAEAPGAAASDELTFAKQVHKVGDKARKSQTMGMTMKIGEAPEMKMDKQEEEAREVLEVAGDTASKIKITYVAGRQVQAMNGKSREKTSPLVGKTYIVWRKDDKVEATR